MRGFGVLELGVLICTFLWPSSKDTLFHYNYLMIHLNRSSHSQLRLSNLLLKLSLMCLEVRKTMPTLHVNDGLDLSLNLSLNRRELSYNLITIYKRII